MKNILLGTITALLTLLTIILDSNYVTESSKSSAAPGAFSYDVKKIEESLDEPPTTCSVSTDTATISVISPNPEIPFHWKVGGATLAGTSYVRTSAHGLAFSEVAPLDAGMVNVTAGFAAYRMNVSLEALSSMEISIPYDTMMLPKGFTEDEIITYCYDAKTKRWLSVPRDSIDMELQLVMSSAQLSSAGADGGDGSLDFINAIIKTPEMPEASSYTPTSIKELEAANPLEGLPLMQPPTANNNGTANLSYPIEIPAGRQGMQPSLALTYSSGGGNGWLGVGWDISIPSISVETRWGVPRYDNQKESEVYVYEGEQLVTMDSNGQFHEMPHRTNQWTLRTSLGDEVQFYPRKSDAFDSIVRHGTNPDNYWWSVTHRNGITDYYGKNFNDESVDYGSVLCNPNTHDIAQWMLTESVDVDGNWIRYSYDTVSYSKYAGESPGRQIYLKKIEYTGWRSATGDSVEQGAYSINFHRRNENRQDVSINLNHGFKESSTELLCNLCVNHLDSEIRAYSFFYENGRHSFFKTRLTEVVRINSLVVGESKCYDSADSWNGGGHIRTHFSYFDAPAADEMFGETVDIGLSDSDDEIKSFFITNAFNLGGEGSATALGATKGKSWNVGGTATVGVGPVVPLTSFSAGGNFNYSRSQSEGALTLIDLDGDGLADKVFKKGKKIFYRKRIATSDTTFFYGDTICIAGLSDFLHETSNTTTWGLQASAGCSYSGSWPYTESTTSIYFSDVNADGLPDLITDDGVLFNVTENGVVGFRNFYIQDNSEEQVVISDSVVTSDLLCSGIIFDGAVDPDIACRLSWVLDTVIDHPTADALLALQDSVNTGRYDLRVRYARYDSTRAMYDEKHLIAELYRKQVVCDPISHDPDLETVKVWVAQSGGWVDINSSIQLLQDTSRSFSQSRWRDGISYAIQICRGVTVDSNYILHSDSLEMLLLDSIGSNDSVRRDQSVNNIHVSQGDILMFRLQSGANRSFDKVIWEQEIAYADNSDTYNSSRDFIVSGDKYFQAHENNSMFKMDIRCRANANTSDIAVLTVLTINGNTTTPDGLYLYAGIDTTIHMSGQLMEEDKILMFLQAQDYGAFQIQPHIHYVFPNSARNPVVLDSVDYYPPVAMLAETDHQTRKDTVYHWLFGPLYRGWGQFAYNNNDTAGGLHVHDSLIDLSMLIPTVLPHPQAQQDAEDDTTAINHFVPTTDTEHPQQSSVIVSAFEASNIYNPLSNTTKWVEMQPDSRHWAWVGYGNINYLAKDTVANTRISEYFADENTIDIVEYDHPVPVVPEGMDVKTIRKINSSSMRNQSLGLSIPLVPINMGVSRSLGNNNVETDYLDLNGDRYPDFVGAVKVQYSQPWGGIGPVRDLSQQVQGISSSATISEGSNFGGSYSMPTRGISNTPRTAKISFDGSGSAGASLGGGSDNSSYTWMDVNGDGLPDKVDALGKVALNKGYEFQPFENWNINVVREGSSRNFGLNMGGNFNVGQASIGGGIGVNLSRNWTDKMLMDFNGDGLPDIIEKSNSAIKVKYNKGNGDWSEEETINGISQISFGRSYSESADISVTLGMTFFTILKVCVGVSGSPYNRSFSKDSVQLTDINGDGYVDYVTSSSEDAMTVRYNKSGKTNLLRKVTNFTGSNFELDYEMPLSRYEKPQRSWNLARVEVRNNVDTCPVGGNRSLTTFSYGAPNYNRMERMDYGYDTVVTYQWDTDGPSDVLYRYTVENYDNQQFSRRGKKTRDCIYDAQGRPYIENIYEVVMADLSSGDTTRETCPSVRYKKHETDLRKFYEGDSVAHVVTAIQREYDSKRNVIRYVNFGYSWNNPAGNDEYFEAEIHYLNGMPHNLISLQDSITVKDRIGNILQRRSARYDNLGHLIHITQHGDFYDAEYDFRYDEYGNIVLVTYPENDSLQRQWCRYVYDSVVHTYPTTVSNAYGYKSHAYYNYYWGKPTKTIDINNNEMWYEYDCLGRMVRVTAPSEQETHAPYTIQFKYHPYYVNLDSTGTQSPYSYAVTYHYDVQHASDPIQTVLITDGLGRLLQTKKDAFIEGQPVNLVTGKVEYDCFGRTLRQYHPFTEMLSLAAIYNDSLTAGTATETSYDILDRQTRIVLPMGAYTTRYDYGFGNHDGRTCFLTTVTDAEGNSTHTFSGSRQQQLKVVAPMNTETTFEYSPILQLLRSVDPDGRQTSYQYDMLGRMIQRTHPDAGTDSYEYDPAGNMVRHNNGIGQDIRYAYHYGQLTDIRHSTYPANDVHYEYGAPGAVHNRAGRIMYQEDASGWQVFSYGKLGEVTENIRTFALPFESQPYTFRMKYKYDSFNRMQQMTYPDGEVVSYHYNSGGMLNSIHGRKGTHQYPYLNHIAYNRFELKDSVLYGNGSFATYRYDTLLRLQHLFCMDALGDTLQNIDYIYDAVSNITDITNNSNVLANGLGGSYEGHYTYDNLYRLIRSDGNWGGTPNTSYELVMRYHRNGRILGKELSATTVRNNAYGNTIHTDWTYNYADGSNKLLEIRDAIQPWVQVFEWDDNGNMTMHKNISEGCIRWYCWDEENRMQGAADCNNASIYQYDANGDRTYKFTGRSVQQGENGGLHNYATLYDPTLYASSYVVCTPRGYTKHYYAESERVASKIGNGCLKSLRNTVNVSANYNKKDVETNPYLRNQESLQEILSEKTQRGIEHFKQIMECLGLSCKVHENALETLSEFEPCNDEIEKECYWYHPDHLGSSSWITFSDGSAVQHLHYLPWGEDFVDQRSTNWNAMHTFSSKERDVETGLSYFGARYYTSDLSIWLSVDPMSDKYPSMSPYAYCANNPVKLVDPNGEEIGDFYAFDGTYLGTDGNNDDIVYLVNGNATNDVDKNRINDPSTIKYSQKTTYGDLSKALEIFAMPNGQKEEGGAFDNNGEWHQGEGYDDHVKLPIPEGKTSIHRHTWGKPDEMYGKYRSPEEPSGKDLETFKNFEQNIIVGKSSGTYDSFIGFQGRKDIISFYGNTGSKTPNCTILRDACQKIVDRGKRIGHIY